MEEKREDNVILSRISHMEALLDSTVRLNGELSRQLEALDHSRADMKELFQYYGSEEWFSDRESPLPPSLKAGVLSEDLVYDQITDLRDACFRMLELATDILKNIL